MAQSIRIQRVARVIQKALGAILVQETSRLLGNILVTITEVRMSPDLGVADVYLSFILNKERGDMLSKVEQHKGTLKKMLGARIGNQLRKIPDLRFYVDDSAVHAAKMQQLLDELDIPEDIDFTQHEELMW